MTLIPQPVTYPPKKFWVFVDVQSKKLVRVILPFDSKLDATLFGVAYLQMPYRKRRLESGKYAIFQPYKAEDAA